MSTLNRGGSKETNILQYFDSFLHCHSGYDLEVEDDFYDLITFSIYGDKDDFEKLLMLFGSGDDNQMIRLSDNCALALFETFHGTKLVDICRTPGDGSNEDYIKVDLWPNDYGLYFKCEVGQNGKLYVSCVDRKDGTEFYIQDVDPDRVAHYGITTGTRVGMVLIPADGGIISKRTRDLTEKDELIDLAHTLDPDEITKILKYAHSLDNEKQDTGPARKLARGSLHGKK